MALLKHGSGRAVKRRVHKKLKVFDRVSHKMETGTEERDREIDKQRPREFQIIKTIFLICSSNTFYSNYLPEFCEPLLNKNRLKLDDDS